MKKIIIALVASLSLSACAQLENAKSIIQLGTATIANPVTKTRLYQAESAATLVVAGLQAWKKSCIRGLINANCKQEIAEVQRYSSQIPPYLTQLRLFIKNNDQVNATIVFNNISSLISTIKVQAQNSSTAANIDLGV
jgi:hypothetical protein